jgi:hypothetical protein
MRHFVGLILAIALAAALFFGGGWGLTHISALAHSSAGLPSRTGLIALAAMGGAGLLLGILLVVPAVSPLATGLPGLVLLAWTALLTVSYARATKWVPLQGTAYGAGFRDLLAAGVLAMLGIVMIIPLFVPSRWHGSQRGYDDEDSGVAATTGLLS